MADRAARVFYWGAATVAGVAMLAGVGAPWAACVAVCGAFVAEVTSTYLRNRNASESQLGALEGILAEERRAREALEASLAKVDTRLVRVENKSGR